MLHCWNPLVEPGRWADHIAKALDNRASSLAGLGDPELVGAFPYFQWLTVGNGVPGINEVRADHAVLHGLIFDGMIHLAEVSSPDGPMVSMLYRATHNWTSA